ncbi:hypothetical protein [Neisseria sp.]|uniref:hypothetical protein n=1 Tax=Neisseria sp. TaxID=192066 RepID=UPI00359FE4B8
MQQRIGYIVSPLTADGLDGTGSYFFIGETDFNRLLQPILQRHYPKNDPFSGETEYRPNPADYNFFTRLQISRTITDIQAVESVLSDDIQFYRRFSGYLLSLLENPENELIEFYGNL